MSSASVDAQRLHSEVTRRFSIRDSYLREGGGLEYVLADSPDVKSGFKGLVRELKPLGYLAILRRHEDKMTLLVAPYVRRIRFRTLTPLILLLATVATIVVDGYFRSSTYVGINSFTMIGLYAAGVLGIIGVHEFGHKVASSRHGVSSSLPYFIPGLPGALPTFGAVIASAEPPVNKDSLFDLGISGPLAGLVVTVLVALGGALTTITLPVDIISQKISQGALELVPKTDLFTEYLLRQFVNVPKDTGPVLSPLTFASSLGFLVTFLNLMPAWQLDGGHLARAVFNRKWHRIATFASIIALFALGFQMMALLILILSFRAPEMQPLDDVSPLSKRRKIIFAAVWILAAALYFFTIKDNPFFYR